MKNKLFARPMTFKEETEVNSLIQFAEKHANSLIDSKEHQKWTGIFCAKMDELAVTAGLRVRLV